MNNQVNVAQIRQIHEVIDRIIPLMNVDEMNKLMSLSQSILDRYKHEKYPDYDWSKDGDSD